jgi:hypothetical protein
VKKVNKKGTYWFFLGEFADALFFVGESEVVQKAGKTLIAVLKHYKPDSALNLRL